MATAESIVIPEKKVWTAAEVKSSYKKKYNNESFRGLDLRYADFRLAQCLHCDFTDCDLRFANFESANCFGSNFTNARMKRVNGKDCSFENTVFKPKDCYGMTITLRCATYANWEVDETWLSCWFFIPSSWKLPAKENDKDYWTKKIIGILGEKLYSRIKFVYDRRVM